jgi:hypothetical protein
MEGHGGPGGSRVVVAVLLEELVRLGVDSPYEEEAGDGGGEEDEDHPQRAHVKLLPCESPKEGKGNVARRKRKIESNWAPNPTTRALFLSLPIPAT